MQRSVGVVDRMAEVGKRVVRNHLNEQHRLFYPLLPFVVLGTVDPGGNAWATLRGGRPGFLLAASPYRLSIQIPRDTSDPADAGMEDGDALALLGIDLTTRRRNRLNGSIERHRGGGRSGRRTELRQLSAIYPTKRVLLRPRPRRTFGCTSRSTDDVRRARARTNPKCGHTVRRVLHRARRWSATSRCFPSRREVGFCPA